MMRGKKELLVSGWFSRESVLCPVSGLVRCLTYFNFTTPSRSPDLGQEILEITFALGINPCSRTLQCEKVPDELKVI